MFTVRFDSNFLPRCLMRSTPCHSNDFRVNELFMQLATRYSSYIARLCMKRRTVGIRTYTDWAIRQAVVSFEPVASVDRS